MSSSLELGADEERIITITSLIPNKCPQDRISSVSLNLDISIKEGPDIKMKQEVNFLPNKLTFAALSILDKEYGFIQGPINQHDRADELREIYPLKPRFQPYKHVKNVTMTVTEIESGDLKFSFAFELYERPMQILKGGHQTHLYTYQCSQKIYQGPDDDLYYSYMADILKDAFNEAEERFTNEFGEDQ
jgi:hypothetical protein